MQEAQQRAGQQGAARAGVEQLWRQRRVVVLCLLAQREQVAQHHGPLPRRERRLPQNQQRGLASAGAWVLFVIILGITAIQFLGQKRWVHYE